MLAGDFRTGKLIGMPDFDVSQLSKPRPEETAIRRHHCRGACRACSSMFNHRRGRFFSRPVRWSRSHSGTQGPPTYTFLHPGIAAYALARTLPRWDSKLCSARLRHHPCRCMAGRLRHGAAISRGQVRDAVRWRHSRTARLTGVVSTAGIIRSGGGELISANSQLGPRRCRGTALQKHDHVHPLRDAGRRA